MASYSEAQYAFLVRRLAEYASHDVIAREFAAQFKGVACTAGDVDRVRREFPAAGWQSHFDEARKAFLDAPTADQRVRVAELNVMFVTARDRNATQEARLILEQIATEMAGGYAPKGAAGQGAISNDPVRPVEWTVVDPKETAPVESVA